MERREVGSSATFRLDCKYRTTTMTLEFQISYVPKATTTGHVADQTVEMEALGTRLVYKTVYYYSETS